MPRIPVNRLAPILRTLEGPVILERYTTPTGRTAQGGKIQGAPELQTRRLMVVHQATPKQLERQDVDNVEDWRAVYDPDPRGLRTTSDADADVIQFQGHRWELVESENYEDLGRMHMALAHRIETTA